MKADKKNVFVKALEGLSAAEIKSEKKLSGNVETGCEMFKAKETEKLCSQLAGTDKETIKSDRQVTP